MKYLLLISIGIFFQLNICSQEIKITASNKALNKVILEIRDNYDVDFSFNDDELSKYKVSVSRTFENIDLALQALFNKLPFEYEITSGVYIIYPKKKKIVEKTKPKVYRISGRIMEAGSKEVLPYSNILINSKGIISDHNGNFLFSSTTDSVFNVKVSHLGYLIEDTIFYVANKSVGIYLSPSNQQLKEIKVSERLLEDFSNSRNEVATIKLNHKVTKYLPGSSDNSVFNLLRLQPGVLAAGEQSNDLIIWGAYAGQSRVIFDGFTVFGVKNFNDNISAINPLITKSIQLRKAGYDASYGDCVGGIVEITGKDGNTQKPHFYAGINNLTLNSLLEIPILKKSSLQLAYRRTYYNLYKDGYNLLPRNNSVNSSDINIYPDYNFNDLNLKYAYKDENNLFYVSILKSDDEFSYFFDQIREFRKIVKTTSEENKQTGAAFFYERKISNKLNSSLLVSYSELSSELNDKSDIYGFISNQLLNQREFTTTNNIRETKIEHKTSYQARKNHTFELIIQAIENSSVLNEDSSNIQLRSSDDIGAYYTLGFKDVMSLKKIRLNWGVRASLLPYLKKSFFEPRVSFSHNLSANFKYNLAWGIYKQFLVKSSVIDEYGNYRYNWTISDGENTPVLNSNHFVGGFSYGKNNLFVSVDAYYKNTFGLTRYLRYYQNPGQADQQEFQEGIFSGDAKSYGIDFYAKYNLKGHTIWLSYTLSKSLDHFSYLRTSNYVFAPQDQRNEIKLASIVNLNPVFFSVNYVYGSGFLEKPYRQFISDDRIPYSRLDVSATYRFSRSNFTAEYGISILNVLNKENQKYSNFEKIPLSQSSSVNIYFEAIPFTPTIFLKIRI